MSHFCVRPIGKPHESNSKREKHARHTADCICVVCAVGLPRVSAVVRVHNLHIVQTACRSHQQPAQSLLTVYAHLTTV